jgi:DNA-binding NarL/FixJ family response regulator
MGKIKVVIAEDHAVVRQGLKVLVQEGPDMEVVGEARNGREAVALSNKFGPDVVVMDIVMPLMGGAAATREVLKTRPKTRVLVLSSYTGEECVWDLLQAGAVGYLTKHSASEELLQAIRDVHRGGSYFSPGIARNIRKKIAQSNRTAAPGQPRLPLSPREAQVLKLIAEGLPNKQIAGVLGISIKTVEKHRQQLIDKLDIHDTAGLTRYAVERGVVPAAQLTEARQKLTGQQLRLRNV